MTPLVAELLRRHREDLIRADHDRAFRVVVLWLLTALSAAFFAFAYSIRLT
jgi:hypothetical protein